MKAFSVLLLTLLSTPLFAHVTLETPSAATGSYYKAVLKVGHGCDGSPTTGIRVDLPEGVQLARPMPKAGWTVTAAKGAVTPFDNHGKSVSVDTRSISWTGGSLPADFYDEFVFQTRISAKPGPLYFKVKQTCQNGSTDWSAIPAAGQDPHTLPTPAAVLEVTPAEQHHHH